MLVFDKAAFFTQTFTIQLELGRLMSIKLRHSPCFVYFLKQEYFSSLNFVSFTMACTSWLFILPLFPIRNGNPLWFGYTLCDSSTKLALLWVVNFEFNRACMRELDGRQRIRNLIRFLLFEGIRIIRNSVTSLFILGLRNKIERIYSSFHQLYPSY